MSASRQSTVGFALAGKRPRRSASLSPRRRGNIMPMACVFLAIFCTIMAFVVDLARLHYARAQLQAAADAAALAATGKLRIGGNALTIYSYGASSNSTSTARSAAQLIVSLNAAAHRLPKTSTPLTIHANTSNASDGEIVFGRASNLGDAFNPTEYRPNSTLVQFGFKNTSANGNIGIIFNGLLGMSESSMVCRAQAMTRIPTLLPFVIYEPQWQALMDGGGADNFAVSGGMVSAGADGIMEMTVFPNDWNGLEMPPGNFGWVDLAPEAGTEILCRLVDEGPTESDMNFLGGVIEAGDTVSGVTGFRAGTEAAFMGGTVGAASYAGILGQPRYIGVYNSASGNGTSAQFVISKFVLVRVVYANLDTQPKGIVIQSVTKRESLERVWLIK